MGCWAKRNPHLRERCIGYRPGPPSLPYSISTRPSRIVSEPDIEIDAGDVEEYSVEEPLDPIDLHPAEEAFWHDQDQKGQSFTYRRALSVDEQVKRQLKRTRRANKKERQQGRSLGDGV